MTKTVNGYPKNCVLPKQRERYDRKQEYLRIKKEQGLDQAKKVYSYTTNHCTNKYHRLCKNRSKVCQCRCHYKSLKRIKSEIERKTVREVKKEVNSMHGVFYMWKCQITEEEYAKKVYDDINLRILWERSEELDLFSEAR